MNCKEKGIVKRDNYQYADSLFYSVVQRMALCGMISPLAGLDLSVPEMFERMFDQGEIICIYSVSAGSE